MMSEDVIKYEFERNNLVYNINYNTTCDELLQNLIKKKKDNIWDVYNFYLIASHSYFNFDFESYNDIEKKIEENLNKVEIEWYKIKRFQRLIENYINEMTRKDIDIQTNETPWIQINLDSFYNINLLNIINIDYNTILKKTKDIEIKKKIINNNLVISALDAYKDIIFFNKKKYHDMSIKDKIEIPDILNNINFTKGYVLVLKPESVEIFKKLIYVRKIIKFKNEKIEALRVNKVYDSLQNENYNWSIWIKNLNITNVSNLNNNNIYNNILNDSIEGNILTDPINFLNSIPLKYNKIIFDNIYNIADKSDVKNKIWISKNNLKTQIYNVSNENNNEIIKISDDTNGLQKTINDTAFLELTKIQYERMGNHFFLNYKYDSRTRLYVYNYPINYQLSHLIRCTIELYNNKNHKNIENIVFSFYNLSFFKKFNIDPFELNLFYYNKIKNIENIVLRLNKMNFSVKYYKNKTIKNITSNLYLESILIVLIRLAHKDILNLEKKIEFSLDFLDDFINTNLQDYNEIEKWLKKLKYTKKKIIYIINLQNLLKNIKNNIYNDIFWVDASSNGVQLITFRLGDFKNELLQITNIIDNNTNYSSIYNYATEQIKKKNHNDFLKTLDYKITNEELIKLQNDNKNKIEIMTGGYGKGYLSSRRDHHKLIDIENIPTWIKLSTKDQHKISDYFWNLTFDIIKEIGFDLKLYKKHCDEISNSNIKTYCWYSDSKLPIVPINIYITKRKKYLQNIQILKLKIKDTENKIEIEKLKKSVEKIKELIKFDEQKYYKRSIIKSKNFTARIRIPYNKNEINKRETKLSIIPNSIHSYDASNIIETLKLCHTLNIETLVIFDAMGTHIALVPILKLLFKIANITNIENSRENSMFPFKEITIKLNKNERVELYKKILESNYFIK